MRPRRATGAGRTHPLRAAPAATGRESGSRLREEAVGGSEARRRLSPSACRRKWTGQARRAESLLSQTLESPNPLLGGARYTSPRTVTAVESWSRIVHSGLCSRGRGGNSLSEGNWIFFALTLSFCECGRGAVHWTLRKELRRRGRPTPVYVVFERSGRGERGRNLRSTFSSCDVPNAVLRRLT